MKKYRMVLSVLGIAILWAGTVLAAGGGDHICFRRIDVNQDGRVTLEEFSVHYETAEQSFKAVDADGDGVLTHDEYHDFLGHGAVGEKDKE